MAAQVFFFLNVRPLRPAPFLVAFHALGELVVPYVGRGYVDRRRRKAQRELLRIHAFARTLAACYQYNLSHFYM